MNETLRQTRAVARVLVRFWLRGPIAVRGRIRRTERGSGLLLRLLFFSFFAGMGALAGMPTASLSGGPRAIAFLFLAFGAFGMCVVSGVGASGPVLRGPVGILESSFLDPLPLRESSRVVTTLAQSLHLHALGAMAFVLSALPGHEARGVFLGLAITVSGLLVGAALGRAFRVVLSPLAAARVTSAFVFVQFVPMLFVVDAPVAATTTHLERHLPSAARAVSWIVDGSGVWLFLGWSAAMWLTASLTIRSLERFGYDRVQALPVRKVASRPDAPLGIGPVSRLLAAREPGGRARWFVTLYTLFLVSTFLGKHGAHRATNEKAIFGVNVVVSMATFIAFSVGSAFSWRAAERDLAARPLLSSLPITPADLLRDKARETRRLAMAVASPIALLPFLPGAHDQRFEAVWRVVTAFVGIFVTAGSVSSVAFLVVGIGAGRRAGSAPTLEAMLLLLPLVSVTGAPYLPSALVSLVCVALLAFEARRAALTRVQWLEDDDVAPETPVWRTLLVFASFQAVQTLLGQLAKLLTSDATLALAACYVVSAIALVALTVFERRGAPRITVMPASPWWLGAGALGGVLSGAFALGYRHALDRLGVATDPLPELRALAWLVPAFVIAAPFAEEMFFRGLLQRVLEHDRSTWLALALSAFAFAAVHPPLSFLPVLVLGLVASALFSRTRAIGPGIAAHAIHNAIALGVVAWPHVG